MKIGIQELILIFVVALVVLGPDKLPEYAKKLGEALAAFKKYSNEATKDIRENIVEPLNEAQRPIREAMEPVKEMEKEVRDNARAVKKSFDDLGKPDSGGAKKASGTAVKGEDAAREETGDAADAEPTVNEGAGQSKTVGAVETADIKMDGNNGTGAAEPNTDGDSADAASQTEPASQPESV